MKRAFAQAKMRKVPHPMEEIMTGVTWTTRKLKSLRSETKQVRNAAESPCVVGILRFTHQLAMVETALALVRIRRGLSSAG